MKWILATVIALIILRFIIGGLRTRCPKCSTVRVHKKVEGEIECLSCSHLYRKKDAVDWQEIAFKLGEEKALEEYKNIKNLK